MHVKAYERMLPILTLARCKKLKKKEIDDRVLKIENSPVYIGLKSYYEEQTQDYWEMLELIGDCNDLIILAARKKALRELWRVCYGQQDKD